jgi:hypothetical protein
MDQQGAVIVGARALLRDGAGRERSGITDQEGRFVFSELPVGIYSIRIAADHFKVFEDQTIQVVPNPGITLRVTLGIAGVEESIAVFADTSVARVAEYIGGSLVIRGDALLALDSPGGLEAFLRALALRTSGPFGPVALVNGFEDAEIPPTYSIREIRINDNPFSAEYATPGLGRIEILTKPGTERLHLTTFGAIGDANWNSRNPFAANTVPYRSQTYGGNIGGPIRPKRAAFFIDYNVQQVDTNAVINATVVDSDAIVPLRQAVVTPQWRRSFSPRLDLQAGTNHTWVMRYGESRSHANNSGVGEFSLVSRAQSSNSRVQTFQLTETAVLNSKAINETRAQYVRTSSSSYGNNFAPTINVPGSFVGGGADIGSAYNKQHLAELQSVVSWQTEKHVVKAGLQGRYTKQVDESDHNFGGTYTFASKIGPQLNDRNEVVIGNDGAPVRIPITTIEAYRRTVLFRQRGFSPETIRELGGGPGQFSITTGGIRTSVWQYQSGAFIQDNWRLQPNLTLSGGVRYEHQRFDSRILNFAPRVSFAWGIGGGAAAPRTVVRAGIGIFYDRIAESVVLRARQLDGLRQRQYFVTDNSILDLFPAVPTPALLNRFTVPQSTVRLASDLRPPYTINSSLALERQLPGGVSVALTASRLRGVHLLRSRNVNAPLPETYASLMPGAERPFGTSADIFQYESSGIFEQRQLLMNLVYRAGKQVTLWSTYTLSSAKSDTDSADTFPANSYDLRSEYGRAAGQPRHTFYWGGWIRVKGGIEITPLALWRSKTSFDIVTGRDANRDSVFTDRPAFATDLTRPSVVRTRFGIFDVDPSPSQRIIPRNFGYSPDFFIANLRVGKRFSLGSKLLVSLSVQGTNIFNHTNPGTPVGNLGSPSFGTSNVSAGDWGFGSNQAGNRRLETMLYFHF